MIKLVFNPPKSNHPSEIIVNSCAPDIARQIAEQLGYEPQEYTLDRMQRDFSVLLLYPDYLNDSGTETYFDHVCAVDAHEATKIVQKRAAAANPGVDYDDFALLGVFVGRVEIEERPNQP